MTLNKEEAKELMELARSKGLIHEVHFHNRFYGANFEGKHAIKEIGDIFSIHGVYVQDWMLQDERTNWRMSKNLSGKTRVIGDIGSHFMDTIEYVSGHRIVEVCAEFKTIYDERNNQMVDTEDLAAVLFRTNQGALGAFFVSQSTSGVKNLLQTTYSGKLGSFEWNSSHSTDYKQGFTDGRKTLSVKQIDTLGLGEYHQAEEFIDAFREAFRQVYHKYQFKDFKGSYATFEDGYHSMCIIDAIHESSIKRGWVKVND